jgi:hypothetical protein
MANLKAPVRVYRTFPKVGRHVHYIDPVEGNPRNGEGSFIRLANGDIMHVYSRYVGQDYHDDCRAEIAGIISRDEGETWGQPFTILPCPESARNLMSVSMLRLGNGDIGLGYIQKEDYEGFVICRYMLVRSADEGKTWSEPVSCIDDPDRYIINNDRVVRLQNGDILFCAAIHPIAEKLSKLTNEKITRGVARFFRSTDDGKTFTDQGIVLCAPFDGTDPTGLQEPGLFQFEDGRIWVYFRTRLGCQYVSYSDDGGYTWSPVVPDFRFTSPRSPMLVKTVGKYTVSVFNPVPENAFNPAPFGMDRTPLMLSVSEDGGLTFPRSYLLEDDPRNAYCYPAIIECEGGFLVSYYDSNGSGIFLHGTRITKVSFDEIK